VTFVLGGPPEVLELSPNMADVAVLLGAEGMIPRLKYRSQSTSAP
jgi:hypothetical protein